MAEVGERTNATGDTHAVFVSYASQDAAVAHAIVETLESHGLSCWIAPRDVVPGEFYADAIVRAIDAARVVVLTLSQSAASSPHVLREVERAASKRLPVLSFRIDAVPLPAALEYFLNTSQWLDASATGADRALPTLVDAVRRSLSRAPVETTVPAGEAAPPRTAVGPRWSAPTSAWRRPTRAAVALIAAAGVAFAYVTINRLRLTKPALPDRPLVAPAPTVPSGSPAAPAIPEQSVAVLPFVDMSEKHDQEYFSDGMAEEIIDLLVKVPELRVPARTSSFYFKGKAEDIPTIAKKLMVAQVLEGSVRRSGTHIRVTAQLIRADSGYHLWSETYDRELRDVFKVQDEIAAAVVSALKLSLLTKPLAKAAHVANTDAYTLYLQAGSLLRHGDTETANDYLQQSVRLDATFAPAWARLTQAITSRFESGAIPFRPAGEAARRAAERAIGLDPALGAAHLAMARVHAFFDWDWAAASAEIQRAREIDPNDTDALRWAGSVALTVGRFSESAELLRQAADRDPLMAANYSQLGLAYLAGGKTAAARLAWQKAVDLASPDGFGAREGLLLLLLITGHADELLAQCPLIPGEDGLECRALAFYATGHKPEADAALTDLRTHYSAHNEYTIASIYAFRAERDEAFAWLDRAYDARDHGLLDILHDPLLGNLRSDPRYAAFTKKMGLSH